MTKPNATDKSARSKTLVSQFSEKARAHWDGADLMTRIIYILGAAVLIYVAVNLAQSHLPGPVVRGPAVKEYLEHRLVRIPAKEWVGGVLAGFAYYLWAPLWVVRLCVVMVFILLRELRTAMVVAYVLLWFFMPKIDFVPADFALRTVGP